ncbi:MAG: hypothetical protein F9B45_22345 [Phycisphaera sp. RhM]|nr:hypothetical protein [Phycisphaera sp. RhM]
MSGSDHDRPGNTPSDTKNITASGAESQQTSPGGFRSDLERDVSTREQRKLKARAEVHRTIWFGLGTFGLVGWSVTLPALAGIALGVWIDHRFPSRFSWTLMLLVLGVALGCMNAWRWISRESQNEVRH